MSVGRQAGWIMGAAALLAAVAVLAPHSGTSRPLPGGFLVDAQGRPSPLAREMAPVTLVHFWASWCPPCLEEIPELVRLTREVRDERFRLVLVAVADRPEAANRILSGKPLSTLYDPSWGVAHRFGTTQLPETYLVVRGEVREKFVGATAWSDTAIRRRLDAAIGPPPGS